MHRRFSTTKRLQEMCNRTMCLLSAISGDTNDRRSTSGYLFFLNDGLISWQSRKQNSVATSSTQAEYHSLSTAAKESIWIRQFLTEIGHQQSKPTTILPDNQST